MHNALAYCVLCSVQRNQTIKMGMLYCVGRWRLYAADILHCTSKDSKHSATVHTYTYTLTYFTLYASTFNVNCNVILTRCHDLTLNNVSILSLLTIDPALNSALFPKSDRKIDFHNIFNSKYHVQTCTTHSTCV